MGKAPAFQFYANDFMDATRMWDAFACGLYIRLLCIQWTHGSVPDDQRRLAKGAGCDLSELQREWHLIEPKFPICPDGTRKNPRLEAVRSRQEAVSGKRSEAANTRWKGNANADANGHAKHKQRKVKVEGEVETEEEGEASVNWPAWAGPNTLAVWEDFKAYRLTEKKERYKSAKTEQRAVNILAKYFTCGQDCVEALEHSMGKGWLFPVDPTEYKYPTQQEADV